MEKKKQDNIGRAFAQIDTAIEELHRQIRQNAEDIKQLREVMNELGKKAQNQQNQLVKLDGTDFDKRFNERIKPIIKSINEVYNAEMKYMDDRGIREYYDNKAEDFYRSDEFDRLQRKYYGAIKY